jgi:serine palmitoyltransferase
MAPSDWVTAVGRIRRFLAVSAIATSNVHKCFNGLEQFMLAPPDLQRESFYDCYDAQEDVEPERGAQVPAWQVYSSGAATATAAAIAQPRDEGDDIAGCELGDPDAQNTGKEWDEEQPIDSQFGPIASQTHRYVSEYRGGPLPRLVIDEPSYFYLLTTYMSYMILIAFGHTRDFFGKRFTPEKYKDFKQRDGYAALNSDFDNFYFRRLKARMNDCFMRPYESPPSANFSC